ncbi:SpaH/EbpB family LPXTG-anchored major pilin [Anaerobutyricum soehngenii]|uniref:SpaH/EbpB family LPXTG-anchored major pilin n=1 Tax=Anaerobutyricum soehngenii TaxID=105843 RepID=UPI001C0F43FF|nr:SpaH/EbpB family LPXTG-anchored major pilin [Anaerobutyricum soehngenii]MBU5417366.1 SpaH/EbpB family LPXTG-anchored major pilin [Anaerobutyricum soehngenii]
MKKLLKQLLAVTTAIMMAITLLPAMANAETKSNGTLQIIKHGKDEKTLLGGAEFTFYKLASITNSTSNSAGTDWKYTVEKHYEEVLGENKEKNLNDLPSKTWEEKTTIDRLSVLAEKDTSGIKSGLTADKDDEANNTKKGYTNKKPLDFGVYLVKETTTPSGHVAGEPFIVSIPSTNNYNYGKEGGTEQETGTDFVYDIVAAPKNSEVPVTKTANDTSVAIGQTVTYTVNTTIPKYGTEYFYTDKDGKNVVPKFEVYDTLSAGLTLKKESITVKVGNDVISADNYRSSFTNIGEKTFLLSFKSDYLKKMETSQAITITYEATVNENAVYQNGNTAGVKYSNKPGESTLGDPVESKEDVYTYGIDLTKTGDKQGDEEGLNGAEFTLSSSTRNLFKVLVNEKTVVVTDENGNPVDKIEKNITNDKGKLVFKGLAEGTYTLTETKAPAGYTLLKNPITIVIGANEDDGTIKSATVNGKETETTEGVVPVNIENHSGFTLPGTGGMGTYIFTIGGLVVMAGAVLLLVSSKKKRA